VSPGHPSNTAETTRAVSPVIGVVLLVAVTVVLAGTVVAFFLGADSGLRQPAPQVAQANADLDTQDGFGGGIITVTHQGGDPVTVADVRIVVDTSDVADCSVDQAVIENLPATARFGGTLGHDDENLANNADDGTDDNSPISQGGPSSKWSAGALHTDTGETFAAGDSFQFRLTGGDGPEDCPLESGETVRITVAHEPSKQSIITVSVTAR
jgi:flagellin-like protein